MRSRSFTKQRGLLLATLALAVVLVAPDLGGAAGAQVISTPSSAQTARPASGAGHVELTAKKKKKKRKRMTAAQKKAALESYLRTHPQAAARAIAAKRTTGTTAKTGTTKTGKSAARTAAIRRAIKAKGLNGKKTATTKNKKKKKTTGTGKAKTANKKKASSLSLPTLALFAIAPFVLMGAFLLGSDYMRRRPPKKRRASLVITRVGGR